MLHQPRTSLLNSNSSSLSSNRQRSSWSNDNNTAPTRSHINLTTTGPPTTKPADEKAEDDGSIAYSCHSGVSEWSLYSCSFHPPEAEHVPVWVVDRLYPFPTLERLKRCVMSLSEPNLITAGSLPSPASSKAEPSSPATPPKYVFGKKNLPTVSSRKLESNGTHSKVNAKIMKSEETENECNRRHVPYQKPPRTALTTTAPKIDQTVACPTFTSPTDSLSEVDSASEMAAASRSFEGNYTTTKSAIEAPNTFSSPQNPSTTATVATHLQVISPAKAVVSSPFNPSSTFRNLSPLPSQNQLPLPSRVPGRPPTMTHRATSVTLPQSRSLLRHSSVQSVISKKKPNALSQRAQSNATSSSQHRRSNEANGSFCFSVDSLRQIHDTTIVATTPLTATRSSSTTSDSWATAPLTSIRCSFLSRDVSALVDDEEEDEFDWRMQLSTGGSEEEELKGDDDGTASRGYSNSPTSVRTPLPDWMLTWAGTADGNVAETDNTLSVGSENSSSLRLAESETPYETICRAPHEDESEVRPIVLPAVYLPDASNVDNTLGWMAVSRDDALFRKVGTSLDRSDIAKVKICLSQTRDQCLLVSEGQRESSLDVSNCYVSTELVSAEWGRAVVLRDRCRHHIRCTLLPVSLPSAFFFPRSPDTSTQEGQRELIPMDQFDRLSRSMSTPFSTVYVDDENSSTSNYAPDAQQDAVMNVLFRLDTCLRAVAR